MSIPFCDWIANSPVSIGMQPRFDFGGSRCSAILTWHIIKLGDHVTASHVTDKVTCHITWQPRWRDGSSRSPLSAIIGRRHLQIYSPNCTFFCFQLSVGFWFIACKLRYVPYSSLLWHATCYSVFTATYVSKSIINDCATDSSIRLLKIHCERINHCKTVPS